MRNHLGLASHAERIGSFGPGLSEMQTFDLTVTVFPLFVMSQGTHSCGAAHIHTSFAFGNSEQLRVKP